MKSNQLESQRLDHLGIVAGICNEMGLIEEIDEQIGHQERKVSVGQAVQAMVVNGLGYVSRPLYLTPEFFHNKPVELLVGEGLEAEDLNDDSLGRALDRLFEAGVTEVFTAVSARALDAFGIETRYAHLDSTSFGLHGEYDVDEEETGGRVPITITHGYSRDHRPDLKQAVLSLICANSSSLPTWLKALNGNQSDSSSFSGTVKAYLDQFGEEEEMPVIVADAALYSKKTLRAMPEGARWISRVPSTLAAAKTLYTEVGEDAMVDTDEDTRYAEFGTYYGGVRQRWLLVLHEPTRKKRDETLEKRVEKEREQAKKDLWHLENEEYACEDALERDLEALKKKWRYHDVSGEVHIEKRYEQSGRPTDDTPYHPVWRFEGQVVADEEHLERLRQRHGKYIIATNELDETCLSSQKMLAIYKEQSTSVERGFRFLKDPMFFAHSLFLKKPSRIMALLMIMGLSLLVYALGERRLRAELVARNETIPDQKGQPTQRPTLRRIFQMLEGIDALYIEKSGSRQRLILNMTDLRRQILNLFGSAVQILYDLPT